MIPLRDHNPTKGFPLVTILLIAANAYGFFLEITAPDFERFVGTYSFVPATFSLADPSTWWQVLTSMFMHASWLHILSNMWFLWIFGNNVEEVLGKFKYLTMYLIAGAVGTLSQYFLNPGSTIPMLGASGAVAGVLGSYLVMFPNHRIDTLVPIGIIFVTQISAKVMIGYWFLLQVFSGVGSIGRLDSGGVAFFAHIGGFILGWLFAKLLSRRQPPPVEYGY